MGKLRKVLLVGVLPGMTQKEADNLRETMVKDFPDHDIRLVAGMLSATTFEVDRTITLAGDETPGLYL